MPDTFLLAFIFFAFLAAGGIKGAFGIGLPTASIGLMTLVIDPRQAIAILLIPMLATNAWQVWRMGETRSAFRRYLPFGTAMVLGIWVSVNLSADAPDRLLFALLGIAMIGFVTVNAMHWAPEIPPHRDRAAQIGLGSISGILGGLTSVWAPPMVIYLASRRAAKDEFVRATGLLIFLGSLPLTAGYLRHGYLDRPTALVGALMLAPALAGFALGERVRSRLSEERFRTVLLGLFFVMGLNLLRRALF